MGSASFGHNINGSIYMGFNYLGRITGKLVAMLQQEILGMDKVIGRIYAHMDRLMEK